MVDQPDRDTPTPGASRYVLVVVAVAVIAVAGLAGFAAFPGFDLPAVQGFTLLGLAAAAGLASFFSPCSFPLLVGLLGRQAVAQAGPDRQRPTVYAGALAVGAAAGGSALFGGITFTSTAGITPRAVVGALLVMLGLVQAGKLAGGRLNFFDRFQRPLTRGHARLRRRHPVAGFGLFGFGYVLAGFALTVGGFGAALTAFVVAAVVISGLMFTAAFAVAGAHRATVERVQTQAPTIKKWGGYLLILVGAWFLALAIFVDVFAALFPV